MKHFLKSQALYCVLCGLLCLASVPAFAQEPSMKKPVTTQPADTIKPKPTVQVIRDNTKTHVDVDTIKPIDLIGQQPATMGTGMNTGNVSEMVRSWPETARMASEATIAKYGQPTESTEDMLIWKSNGIWKKTVVSKMETQHDFPKSHKDVLEQTIYYKVPVEFFDDLASFDGSITVNRTKGTISARCDKEAFNFLALNLAHEIVTGKRTVESARTFLAQTAAGYPGGPNGTYTAGLLFKTETNEVGDPDKMAATSEMKDSKQPAQDKKTSKKNQE